MTEEAVVVESKATVEQQAAAEKLGWIPASRFKGDPERFIDADAYIERGETVLPIVKEHNKRLQGQVESLTAESAATKAALKAAQDAIEQIEERHSVETQKAVAAARKQVKEQLAKASEDGDHEGVAELTDQLTQLNAAEEKPPEKKAAAAPPAFVPHPDLKAWNEENSWFGTSRRKTALALGIAQELREAGEKSVGRPFYDLVAAEVEKETGGSKKAEPRGDKVEGARNSDEGEVRSGGKKSYANLPADAKTACDADGKRFIGADKKYKTAAEWRQRYAEIYFEEGV